MRTSLFVALLALPAFAQDPVARVNDLVSPGVLGDQLLSLDEAIRVVNGTLPLAQLSPAERARISGSGLPNKIEIDAGTTPTLRLVTEPTELADPASGMALMLVGVGGQPVIDASGVGTGLRIAAGHAMVSNLAVLGGQVGIAVRAAMHTPMHGGVDLSGLELRGQTQTSLRLGAMGTMSMLHALVEHTSFHNTATAIELRDQSQAGGIMVDVEHVEFDRVQLGVDVDIAANGAMTMCRLWRCKMPRGDRAARVRRTPTSDQRLMLMIVASEFHTAQDAIDAQGNSVVETAIHVHHTLIQPAAGRRAFIVGPQDARLDFHISENVVHGDVEIAEGRLNRRLWIWNNLLLDGQFLVSNQGAPTSFRWNRFERCTIRALPTNSTPMAHVSSEFVGCTIDGQSVSGRVQLENCWLDAATTTTGSVAQSSPASTPWIAKTSASTDTPSLGGVLELNFDLPPGMLGGWQIGVADPQVVLTQEPFRSYAHRSPSLAVPGIYALNTTLRIDVPNLPALVGAELYCTAVTAPYLGQAHVPVVSLPRGVHLTIGR